MKTLITLLMLSISASTTFAQGNCARLKIQERKITQVEKKIKGQQTAIAAVLKAIDSKENSVNNIAPTAIALGSISSVVGLVEFNFMNAVGSGSVIGKPLMGFGVIAAVGGVAYLYIQSKDLNELKASLEQKQAELDTQNTALIGAKANLELLKSLYPNCNSL